MMVYDVSKPCSSLSAFPWLLVSGGGGGCDYTVTKNDNLGCGLSFECNAPRMVKRRKRCTRSSDGLDV